LVLLVERENSGPVRLWPGSLIKAAVIMSGRAGGLQRLSTDHYLYASLLFLGLTAVKAKRDLFLEEARETMSATGS